MSLQFVTDKQANANRKFALLAFALAVISIPFLGLAFGLAIGFVVWMAGSMSYLIILDKRDHLQRTGRI